MEEHSEIRPENKGQNSQKPIVSAIIIAGMLIAGAILLTGSSAPTENTQAGKVPISKRIGLDAKAFSACLASGKFQAKIQADIDDGVKAGVNGTPSSFILKDGKVVDTIGGAEPMQQVMARVTAAMENDKEPMPGIVVRPVSPDEHILGNTSARIIIVEYSDLECPFCKVFHKTMHQVVENSNGNVAWVYRHYPIPQLHPNAFHEAEATECAWEQGGNDAFWKYTDTLFEVTPSNNGLEESML